MDTLEIDKAIGVLKKLKIADDFFKTLTHRSEVMAQQVALINALKTLDLSVSEIDIDDSTTTMQFKQVIDAILEAKLTLDGDAKQWIDPAGAQMFAKAHSMYADVQKRHGKRLSEQEEERKRKELEKQKYEQEQLEKRKREAEEELAKAKATQDAG